MPRGSNAKTHKTKMKVQFQATGEKRVVKAFRGVDRAARESTGGLDGFRGGLLAVDAATNIATNAMGGLQKAFDLLQAPVGLAVDWQKQFSLIKTLTSEVGDDLEGELLALAASVPQTAGDIAQSAYSAISAGIDPSEVTGFLEAASKAATAGNVTLTESTKALTKTLAGFKNQGLGATRAMDILFKTVQRGDTDFRDLSESVGMVAGAAGTAGVSAEEMGAAIATLSKTAPNTSIAVTNLNAVIKTLVKPTKLSQRAFKALGVEVGAAAVEKKGLINILHELNKAIDGDITKLNSLTRSTEAQSGFNAILGENLKDLDADFRAITDSEGALSDAHAILAKNTATAMASFEAAKEAALRELGNELLPDVNAGLRKLGEWWGEHGAATITQIKRLYRVSKQAFEAFVAWNDFLLKITGIKYARDMIFELSEAMGITTVRAEESAAAIRKMEAASVAASKAASSEIAKSVSDAQRLVDAAITSGDALAAAKVRATQVMLVQDKRLRVEARLQASWQELQATKSQLFQAQNEEHAGRRIALLKAEVTSIELKRAAQKRDIATAQTGADALKRINIEEMARLAKREANERRPSRAPRGGGKSTAVADALRREKELSRLKEDALTWRVQLTQDAMTRELQILSIKHQKELTRVKAFGVEAAEIQSVLLSRQEQQRQKILSTYEERERERKAAFAADIAQRETALDEDPTSQRLASLALAQQQELEIARKGGQDVAALRAVQDREMADATKKAAADANAAQLAQIDAMGSSISKGGALTIGVMESLSAAADAIGVKGDLAEKALAVTKGFVAGADAIRQGAQAAAAYASFNVFSGLQYTAASIGSAAASAAYFKAAGKGSAAASAPVSAPGGGGSAAIQAPPARASASDLGVSQGVSGPAAITIVMNQHAPVFDTQDHVDQALAAGVRRALRSPGGPSSITKSGF